MFFSPAVELPDIFPDGEEVSPEIIVETIQGACCQKKWMPRKNVHPTKKIWHIRFTKEFCSASSLEVEGEWNICSTCGFHEHMGMTLQWVCAKTYTLHLQTGVGGFAWIH